MISILGGDLQEHSELSLQKGSQSFALAAQFFSKELYTDVAHLYSWCRVCDDITDGSTLGFDQNPKGLPRDRVENLKRLSKQSLSGEEQGLDLPFVAFGKVMRKYQIPWTYAEDLLMGMAHDANGDEITTFEDLQLYCYRVAGTVGLMMCHLMGLKDVRALKNAVDLGIALQLTNIARDLGDDFSVSKVYLPKSSLMQAGIPPHDLLNQSYAVELESLVKKLLSEADRRYQSGLRGLKDLPWRCALAVSVAASVYRRIGVLVIQKGHASWKTRVCLNRWDKIQACIKGVALFLTTVPSRIIKPRRVLPIDQIWRYM